MFARTTVCSSLLFVHSIGVHAAVACDVIDPDGLVKICDVPSGREATIDQAFSGQLPILFNEGAFLTVFNAGIIDVVGGTLPWNLREMVFRIEMTAHSCDRMAAPAYTCPPTGTSILVFQSSSRALSPSM